MSFLRRNRFQLLFIAVLILASVMVLRQFMANQSAHFERREDFILLQEMEKQQPAERMYQILIQELPHLNEAALVSDLERMGLIVQSSGTNHEDLIWKYYVSVKNELRKRSEQRLASALKEAQQN